MLSWPPDQHKVSAQIRIGSIYHPFEFQIFRNFMRWYKVFEIEPYILKIQGFL